MSNTRKLRTAEFMDARPGETCIFHPDCCQPDDWDCSGCGEPAVTCVSSYVVPFDGGEPREARHPFCARHAKEAARLLQDMTRQAAN
jgi:hypothetical protein